MIDVCVVAAAVDTCRPARGNAGVDVSYGECRAAPMCSVGANVIPQPLSAVSGPSKALKVSLLMNTFSIAVLLALSVASLIAGGASFVLQDPRPGVLVVALLTVRKAPINSAAIFRERVQRLLSRALRTEFHSESITEKYNVLACLGWRLLRVTPRDVWSGAALSWIQRALPGRG